MSENKKGFRIFIVFIILLLLSIFVLFYLNVNKTSEKKNIENIENIENSEAGLLIETSKQIIERRAILEKITEESIPQTQEEIESNLKILESLNN